MPIQTKLFFRILGGSILVLSFLFSSCGLVLGTIPQAKTDEEKDRVARIKNSDSFRGYPKGQQIAESLLAVKNGRMTEQQFFNRLAELGVGMKEVNEVKSRLIRPMSRRSSTPSACSWANAFPTAKGLRWKRNFWSGDGR